ncbi:type II toxin-antitoxin system HicA family toxin [Parafrankia colletiae]|uniref:type II toxin-antitoxin system HicA family toxin n=1 Tax=Parafrankia colletiae TaxID=573497 RepID=UPI0021100E0D|nr:type II toxin-antitoxin system HicA family toxin [Parafrankia colletiae]
MDQPASTRPAKQQPTVSVDLTPSATRGSHCKLRHKESARVVIVPLHRELATGTLASVLRQAGIEAEELRTLLT